MNSDVRGELMGILPDGNKLLCQNAAFDKTVSSSRLDY